LKKENVMASFWKLALIGSTVFLIAVCASVRAETPEVPIVDGHLGRCSATFTVKGRDQKPLYNAKISVTVRYGPLGLRRMELQVGTNSDGKARVAGLPDGGKKQLRFEIYRGELFKIVSVDPSVECDATIEVNFGNQ